MMAAVFVCLASSTVSQAQQPPNILLIYADDHACQAVSCYGSNRNETPNIDRIAREGMRFENCFVTNSICGPCRAVVLTGRHSHLNGFVRNGDRFNGEQTTFPKLLQQAGYETACIGKWHLGSNPTGFDYWHILIGQGPYYNPPMLTPEGRVPHEGYTTDIITDLTLDWLEEGRDSDKPFFLMYQHKAPHRNWQPGPDHIDDFKEGDLPEPETLLDDYSDRASAASNQEMTVGGHLSRRDLKITPPGNLTPAQREVWDAAYAARIAEFEQLPDDPEIRTRWNYQQYIKDYMRCIASVDDNVGRVLDYLDDSGLAENTIVIYTSDQGFYLGEHGWYDKRWMYEESLRTPFVIRWPDHIEPDSVRDEMVLNLDLAETFLDIAGIDAPENMQGRSIQPLLLGEDVEDWRTSIYYRYYEFPAVHSVAKHYGIRTERYKLIFFEQLDEWELFDLENDPNEMHSVYGEEDYSEIVADLKKQLESLRQQYQDDDTIVQ